jgi:hypothetical protein
MDEADFGWAEFTIHGIERGNNDAYLALAVKDATGAENCQVDLVHCVVRFRVLKPMVWSFDELHRRVEECGWHIDTITIRSRASLSADTATIVETGQRMVLAAPVKPEVIGSALITFRVLPSPDWVNFRVQPGLLALTPEQRSPDTTTALPSRTR